MKNLKDLRKAMDVEIIFKADAESIIQVAINGQKGAILAGISTILQRMAEEMGVPTLVLIEEIKRAQLLFDEHDEDKDEEDEFIKKMMKDIFGIEI